jgi:hypothetical protein
MPTSQTAFPPTATYWELPLLTSPSEPDPSPQPFALSASAALRARVAPPAYSRSDELRIHDQISYLPTALYAQVPTEGRTGGLDVLLVVLDCGDEIRIQRDLREKAALSTSQHTGDQ